MFDVGSPFALTFQSRVESFKLNLALATQPRGQCHKTKAPNKNLALKMSKWVTKMPKWATKTL